MRFKQHPQFVELARELDVATEGDCAATLVEYAVTRAVSYLKEHPTDTLEMFQLLVANRLGVKIEWLRAKADIPKLEEKYRTFCPDIKAHLRAEFILGATEGITLIGEPDRPGGHRYLAVVNAMGTQGSRAYFTSWHEIAHLLIHPPGKTFEPVRRYTFQEGDKDSVEQLVDQIAARLAFYPLFFEPALQRGINRYGGFGFHAIEYARRAAAPEASLFASVLGSMAFYAQPALFLSVEPGFRKAEERVLNSAQQPLDFFQPSFEMQLRATKVIPSRQEQTHIFGIRENMRIPRHSALTTAFESPVDISLVTEEDQDWWETRAKGHLSALPLRVHAARRGSYVYGLLEIAA